MLRASKEDKLKVTKHMRVQLNKHLTTTRSIFQGAQVDAPTKCCWNSKI